MPTKKNSKHEIDKDKKDKENIKKTEDEEKLDDDKSVSTDSDIESGTFSQYDENEVKVEGEEEELEESDSENIEDDIVDAEDEIEEEAVEEEVEEEKIKTKKKKTVKKVIPINTECLYNNIDFEEDYDEKEEQISDDKRITINRMTKYEKVRIIGIRAKQIMTGANILIKGIENKTPTEIAELELKHNMVPFKIKRRLPNGRYEIWKLSELEK
jgi:hypothetical protein